MGKLWIKKGGKLVHVTDESRVKFRTNISKSLLDELTVLAKEHRTYVNYLLENGIENLLDENEIAYDKKSRPKDRVQYKTTYDKELLEDLKEFAKEHRLYINDVIEYSVQFIDFSTIKKASYKHRIE